MEVSQDPPTQRRTQTQPLSPESKYSEIDFDAAYEAVKSFENKEEFFFLIVQIKNKTI